MKHWAVLGACMAPVLAMAGGAQFDCLIEPSQVVELRSAVEGLIQNVTVRRGDMVRRGQVLAQLESGTERLAVESAQIRARMEGQIITAQSRIDYARKKFARAEELQKASMGTSQARDEAEAELNLAGAELKVALENRDLARTEAKRAVEQLAMRTMNSPFDGVVVDRLLNPGDLAEAGTGRKAVLKLAQIDPLRVDIVLPGTLFGRVKAGAKVVVSPHGAGARYTATVGMVDRVVDAASGTLVARVDLPNHEGRVAAGVRCKAEFDPPLLPAGAADR